MIFTRFLLGPDKILFPSKIKSQLILRTDEVTIIKLN